MFRLFLGAPSIADIDKDPSSYQWETISPKPQATQLRPNKSLYASRSVIFPPATLAAASRRISLLYQNTIFDHDPDEAGYGDSPFEKLDQTTVYTWPPTADETDGHTKDETMPSFLLDMSEKSTSNESKLPAHFETQETQETQSYSYSDASSIACFPSFHFSLHSLTSLSSLRRSSPKGSRKITVLLAVLEVDGPNTTKIKRGPDAGKEVSMLSLVLGDEEGMVCKLTAWREIADVWGGAGVKRGDVLYIEHVMATWDAATSPTLSASPFHKSKMEICYRTMPYSREDSRLRPDLRLGESDAAVRKVAAVVRWFEGMAGLDSLR